jgi:hypothetical protein
MRPASDRACEPSRFKACPATSPPTDHPVLIVMSASPAVVASVLAPTDQGGVDGAPNMAAPRRRPRIGRERRLLNRTSGNSGSAERLGQRTPQVDGSRHRCRVSPPIALAGRARLEDGEHQAGQPARRARAQEVEPAAGRAPALGQAAEASPTTSAPRGVRQAPSASSSCRRSRRRGRPHDAGKAPDPVISPRIWPRGPANRSQMIDSARMLPALTPDAAVHDHHWHARRDAIRNRREDDDSRDKRTARADPTGRQRSAS